MDPVINKRWVNTSQAQLPPFHKINYTDREWEVDGELYIMHYVINENLFGKFQFNAKNAFLNRYLTIKIALVINIDYYLRECLYHWKFSWDDLKASTKYPSCETILLKELRQEMNDFNLTDTLLLKKSK